MSRTLSNMRGRSTSPSSHHLQRTVQTITDETNTSEDGKQTVTTTTTTVHTTIPVARNLDNDEPIRLSKFSGGYEPDPDTPRKIETLDWPGPPCPAAVPELRVRSRSSSNRRAQSTVTSIHGTSSVNGDYLDDDEDENEDNDEEIKNVMSNDLNDISYQRYLASVNRQSAASLSSRAKAASRPSSKLRYQNNLFENDYDDYLLKYKSDKEWKKIINKNEAHKRNADVLNENEMNFNKETNEEEGEEGEGEVEGDDEENESVRLARKN